MYQTRTSKKFIRILFLAMLLLFSVTGCGGEDFATSEQLVKISITTPPKTTLYDSGSDFDPTGMVVTATYSSGRTEIIQDYTVDNGKNLVFGTTEITISYQGKTAVQRIEVTPVEVEVLISVKRTGNIISGIGKLSVLIDGEEVFVVSNNSTESVRIVMTEGKHTIQTTGQGDKSKVLEFVVVSGSSNELYFVTEISNWWGVELEERKYIPEE